MQINIFSTIWIMFNITLSIFLFYKITKYINRKLFRKSNMKSLK
ncbi:MAG: hypothetical protein K0R06_2667 [Clostridium sp.]|jgi:hypothetical protein|nr:hypothetical protein [Clostridium sp.]